MMGTTLRTRLQLTLKTELEDALDLSTPKDVLEVVLRDMLLNGTGLDQADMVFHDTRPLTAESEDLDLAGVLKDALGNILTFAKVRGIFIKNNSVVAGEVLKVGGAAATQFVNWVNAATDIVIIGPGGLLLLWNPSAAGYAVGAGASDLLKIDSGGATLTYDIVIIGSSA